MHEWWDLYNWNAGYLYIYLFLCAKRKVGWDTEAPSWPWMMMQCLCTWGRLCLTWWRCFHTPLLTNSLSENREKAKGQGESGKGGQELWMDAEKDGWKNKLSFFSLYSNSLKWSKSVNDMHVAIEIHPLRIVHSTSGSSRNPLVVSHRHLSQPFHTGIYYVNTEYMCRVDIWHPRSDLISLPTSIHQAKHSRDWSNYKTFTPPSKKKKKSCIRYRALHQVLRTSVAGNVISSGQRWINRNKNHHIQYAAAG